MRIHMKSGTELSLQAIDDPIYGNRELIEELFEAFLEASEHDRSLDDLEVGKLVVVEDPRLRKDEPEGRWGFFLRNAADEYPIGTWTWNGHFAVTLLAGESPSHAMN
jgi:hypothetical protein